MLRIAWYTLIAFGVLFFQECFQMCPQFPCLRLSLRGSKLTLAFQTGVSTQVWPKAFEKEKMKNRNLFCGLELMAVLCGPQSISGDHDMCWARGLDPPYFFLCKIWPLAFGITSGVLSWVWREFSYHQRDLLSFAFTQHKMSKLRGCSRHSEGRRTNRENTQIQYVSSVNLSFTHHHCHRTWNHFCARTEHKVNVDNHICFCHQKC